MVDYLAKLNPASWRDIRFPVMGDREYSFAQEQAQHRIIMQDDKLLLSAGRENPTFDYQIPFVESLRTAQWDSLFTKVYPRFLEACKNREAGWLRDPVHGRIWAKCVSLREVLSAVNRSGVIVSAQFVQDREDQPTEQSPVEMPITSLAGAVEQGRRLDAEVQKVDWKQEPEPESNQDLFTSVQAFSDQVGLLRDNTIAKLGNLSAKMDRLTDSIDRLKDPKTALIRQESRRIKLSALALSESAHTPPRPTDVITITTYIGKIALATAHGMTVEEFNRLNPRFKRMLRLPTGSDVVVYRGERI